MAGQLRVFIASSLDGFIAGPNDELDWLDGTADPDNPPKDTFTPFFAQIGAMLMGRRTYDVVCGFDVPWPYGETPVLVATTRPLTSKHETDRPTSGSIEEMVEDAKRTAGDRDVYIDGGALIRSALAANLIDEIIVTVIPVVLGEGLPLFAGADRRHNLDLVSTRDIGGNLVELVYRPRRER